MYWAAGNVDMQAGDKDSGVRDPCFYNLDCCRRSIGCIRRSQVCRKLAPSGSSGPERQAEEVVEQTIIRP